MDAVDAALVKVSDDDIELLHYLDFTLPIELKRRIRTVTASTPVSVISQLDAELGVIFADAANQLLSETELKANEITAIGSHGQTIYHAPDNVPAQTLQIGDANIIACNTNIATVADFRRMDMAYGGQGAPLAPLFHAVKFRTTHDRVILNIGGFSNITLLVENPEINLMGFDTGPGNALMDDWIQHRLDQEYDKDGAWARSGTVNSKLLEALLNSEYFQRQVPKSTGRDDFNLSWLEQKMNAMPMLEKQDIQATLLALTVHSVVNAINLHAANAKDILVCGGGANNIFLMEQLERFLPGKKVLKTTEFGVQTDAVEACCFAWLAHLRMEKVRPPLSSITSARSNSILGGLYLP